MTSTIDKVLQRSQGNPPKRVVDDEAVDNLLSYIDSGNDLYNLGVRRVLKKMKHDLDRGQYDYDLADAEWMRIVNKGARLYSREYGGGKFRPAELEEVAEEMARRFEYRLRHGDY